MSNFDKKLFDKIKPEICIIIKMRNFDGKYELLHKIELIASCTAKRYHIKHSDGVKISFGNGSITQIFKRLRELMTNK